MTSYLIGTQSGAVYYTDVGGGLSVLVPEVYIVGGAVATAALTAHWRASATAKAVPAPIARLSTRWLSKFSAYPAPTGSVVLAGRWTGELRVRPAIAAVASLAARLVSQGKGGTLFAGAAGLAGRLTSMGKDRGLSLALLAFIGTLTAAMRSRAPMAPLAQMQANWVSFLIRGTTGFSGTTIVAGRLTAQLKSRPAIYGIAQLLAKLGSRTGSRSTGTFRLALAARMAAQGLMNGIVTTGVFTAALVGTLAASARARTATIGQVTLAARMQARSGSSSGFTALYALFARLSMGLQGNMGMQGITGLSGRMGAQLRAGPGLGGLVGLTGRLMAQASGRAVSTLAQFAALVGRMTARIGSRTSPRGQVGISGRMKSVSTTAIQMLPIARLVGRLSIQTRLRSTFDKWAYLSGRLTSMTSKVADQPDLPGVLTAFFTGMGKILPRLFGAGLEKPGIAVVTWMAPTTAASVLVQGDVLNRSGLITWADWTESATVDVSWQPAVSAQVVWTP